MLHLVTGPMFSGKTDRLIKLAKDEIIRGKEVTAFLVGIERDHLRSRTGATFLAKPVEADDFLAIHAALHFPGTVIVDEFHLAAWAPLEGIAETLLAHSQRKTLILGGLSTDWKGKAYSRVEALMPLVDRLEVLTAVCAECGQPATRSYRKSPSADAVVLDTGSEYEPRCRWCFEIERNVCWT